jgi:hypothetical protein
MNMKIGWMGVSAAALLLAATAGFVGCSSSDSGGGAGGAGGSAGTAGSAGSAGSGGSAGTGGSAGSGGSDGGAVGVCNNTSDKAATTAGYCPGNASVADIVGNCAKSCITNSDPQGCTKTCLDNATNHAISADCEGCYVALTFCGSQNCLSECLSDPTSATCLACLCGGNSNAVNCYDAFNSCTGLGFTFCQDLDGGTWDGYPAPNPPATDCDGGADAATE